MKYQVGDKILILQSEEEGEVLDILDEKMVMVRVNGVKFPVYTDQIDFPYFKRFSSKKFNKTGNKPKQHIDNIRKETSTQKYKVGDGVWLSFLPVFDKDVFDDDIVEKFKLYLVNQTGYDLSFKYDLSFNNIPDFQLQNEVNSLSDFYLHDIAFEDLNDAPKFAFEFRLQKADKKKAPYFEAFLKPKAKQVFKQIEEMRLKMEASFSYILFEDYPDKAEEIKPDLSKLATAGYRVYDSAGVKSDTLQPPRTVIDLHIDKLTDNWKKMGNAEMLDLQLKTFEKYFDLALQHRQNMLIVVHGVGTGRLREEIHEILRHKKEVKTFVNQFHPSFGYGATEIYFK